jgi:hypothetical protein
MNETPEEQRELASIERKTTSIRSQVKLRHAQIKALVERKKEIRRGITARSRVEKARERRDKGMNRRTQEWTGRMLAILSEYCEGMPTYEMRARYFQGSAGFTGNSLRGAWIEADPDSYERLGGDLAKLRAEGPKDWMKTSTPSSQP